MHCEFERIKIIIKIEKLILKVDAYALMRQYVSVFLQEEYIGLFV